VPDSCALSISDLHSITSSARREYCAQSDYPLAAEPQARHGHCVRATDPDGDPVTVVIAGVTQDEPTNGLGDGDVSPDAVLSGGSTVQLRAERSGLGNGRVYQPADNGDRPVRRIMHR
jgi:hypothetical protein